MDRINLKKGDYVKITKIGCYGEYISYISIVKDYDSENNVLHEIISCLDANDPDEFEVLFYDSVTKDIINIDIANNIDKEYLDKLMKDMDNIYFDSNDLIIKNYD